jgi:hypothetical protein
MDSKWFTAPTSGEPVLCFTDFFGASDFEPNSSSYSSDRSEDDRAKQLRASNRALEAPTPRSDVTPRYLRRFSDATIPRYR